MVHPTASWSWQPLKSGAIGLTEFSTWQEQVTALLTEDPNPWHYALTRRALAGKRVGKKDTISRDKLARVLCEQTRELWQKLRLDKPLASTAQLTEVRDGVLWIDALAAEHFETIGSKSETLAQALRNASRRRVQAYQTKGSTLAKLWLPWHSHRRANEPSPSILLQFCRALWNDVAKDAATLERSPKFRIGGVVPSDGGCYSKVPKVTNAMGWAIGRDTGFEVEIDGECYTQAPELARYMSWGSTVLRPTTQPSERQLAIELGIEQSELELPVSPPALKEGSVHLTPTAGKLGLTLVTSTHEAIVQGTIGELARKLFPNKERLLARDYTATARAVRELERVRVVLDDGTSVRVFDLRSPARPESATKDHPVYWAYSRHFLEALRSKLGSLKGEFIMNLTGALKLEGKTPSLFRHYLFACATWNDAKNPLTKRFDPNYLREFELKEWAAHTNTLSQSAIEYLQGGEFSKRNKLSDDLRKVLQDLEELETKHNLLRVEKLAQHRVKIHPPQALLDAYEMHRKGGARPIG